MTPCSRVYGNDAALSSVSYVGHYIINRKLLASVFSMLPAVLRDREIHAYFTGCSFRKVAYTTCDVEWMDFTNVSEEPAASALSLEGNSDVMYGRGVWDGAARSPVGHSNTQTGGKGRKWK
jgi:hypothetical protein